MKFSPIFSAFAPVVDEIGCWRYPLSFTEWSRDPY